MVGKDEKVEESVGNVAVVAFPAFLAVGA